MLLAQAEKAVAIEVRASIAVFASMDTPNEYEFAKLQAILDECHQRAEQATDALEIHVATHHC